MEIYEIRGTLKAISTFTIELSIFSLGAMVFEDPLIKTICAIPLIIRMGLILLSLGSTTVPR